MNYIASYFIAIYRYYINFLSQFKTVQSVLYNI